MIAERIPQQQQQQQQLNNNFSESNTKYYQFSTILEHVIDCFHTIVSDETNPYHQPFTGWLTRKQPKPPNDELFLDLVDDCNKSGQSTAANSEMQLSSSVKTRLEKCPQQLRKEIVSRQQDGCSPLFIASKNGLTRIIKYLLDVCEADIEQKGCYEASKDQHVHSVSPIWVAAVSGQLNAVRLLIERGANVNSMSDTGSTPIRSVCFLCRDDDGVQEYDNLQDDTFSFGVLDNEEDSDIYMKIVRLLIDNGADISKPNYNGGTCLINSLHSHRLTKYIIEHGANVNAFDNQSKTALHYAIQHDRLEVVKLLLEHGADPFMQTITCDDALQLSCMGGHIDIFKYLIDNYTYDPVRLSDAHRLMGSSILEICYDLTQVREYWTTSLKILNSATSKVILSETQELTPAICNTPGLNQTQTSLVSQATGFNDDDIDETFNICDSRRMIAYGNTKEFSSLDELQSLSVDDFRIQSLLVSERIIGSHHRETIQRLLYRGTFYINSLRHTRCLDMWIYALKLRLDTDSIFNFESIFAAQAITRLFLDLFSQAQHQLVKFNDVFDVLTLLVGRLRGCQHQLSFRPRSCLHEDIFDLLLNMIVNLLLILRSVQRRSDEFKQTKRIIEKLVNLNLHSTNGSSLLHICVAPNMLEGEIHRSLTLAYDSLYARNNQHTNHPANRARQLGGDISADAALKRNERTGGSPLIEIITSLIEAGLEVDSINQDGLSALQVLCLASSIRTADKRKLIKLLVKSGAHVDRRALTPEQDEQVRQALLDADVKPFEFVTLKCLAARQVSKVLSLSGENPTLTRSLDELIAIH